MGLETSIGAGNRSFPSTQWSKLLDLRDRRASGYADAVNDLCRLYWKPVYVHLRASRPLGNEEAKDLTQGFFVEFIESDLISRVTPQRGSFRSYLKGALRLFLLEQHRNATAMKRGGERPPVSLDAGELHRLEEQLAGSMPGPDEAFDRQWMNSVLEHALADLRGELTAAGKQVQWRLFERFQLSDASRERPSHADLAKEFGVRESDVNHHLADCRKALRTHLVARIRAYLGDEAEIADELHRLFSMGEPKSRA